MIDNRAALDANARPAGGLASARRDDRIFPEVRWVGAFIVLVLVIASAILLVVPDRTKEFFAWDIKPTMTPLMMGAGYLSGGWFFLRVFFAPKWHHVGWGFLAITTFTWFMGVATILHWNKFTPGHPSFYAWAILYFVTPFLVPFLWYRNRVTDPGTPDPGDVVVPATVRRVSLVAGAILLLIALFLFLVPDVAISIWPWKVTALTARVVAGWFALPGVVGVAVAQDSRWSAWRILLQSQMIGIALILIGAARAWNEFDTASWTTWAFTIGLALLLAWIAGLYITMETRRRRVSA